MLVLTKFISRLIKIETPENKYSTIDGLRGYLAFFVFMHHSYIYFFYMKTQKWEGNPSYIFQHFGKTSVALFFMITGFLFFSKLIDKYNSKLDWVHFFVSRVMRLYPLYLVVLLIMFIYVGILSNFALKGSIIKLIYEMGQWFLFKIFADTPINGVADPSRMTAGVLWSLSYEWLFYFALPIMALIFFRIKVSLATILITLGLAILIIMQKDFMPVHIFSFFGGIIGAFLIRMNFVRKLASTKTSSLIIIICFIVTVVCYPGANSSVPLILISIAFILIACGNSLFGILTRNISRTLGQMSYTIYLLHGLILFLTFRLCIGFDRGKEITLFQHWLIIGGCSVILTFLIFLAYKYIEFPAMKSASKISKKINNSLGTLKLLKRKPALSK